MYKRSDAQSHQVGLDLGGRSGWLKKQLNNHKAYFNQVQLFNCELVASITLIVFSHWVFLVLKSLIFFWWAWLLITIFSFSFSSLVFFCTVRSSDDR